MSTPITITGRLVADPELRFTPSGAAVANFTIAHNRRKFDRNSNEWKDEGTDFYRCSAWRELAENIAEAWAKGMLVIASGTIEQREYETREGEKRSVWEVTVEDAGSSLKWKPRAASGAGQPRAYDSSKGQAEQMYGGQQSNPWDNQEAPF